MNKLSRKKTAQYSKIGLNQIIYNCGYIDVSGYFITDT
jgi:hypothetical protein